jgi:hypothetical protein
VIYPCDGITYTGRISRNGLDDGITPAVGPHEFVPGDRISLASSLPCATSVPISGGARYVADESTVGPSVRMTEHDQRLARSSTIRTERGHHSRAP